jgi:hypothetical protein
VIAVGDETAHVSLDRLSLDRLGTLAQGTLAQGTLARSFRPQYLGYRDVLFGQWLPGPVGEGALPGEELGAHGDRGQRFRVGVVKDDGFPRKGVQVRCAAGGDAIKDGLTIIIETDVILAKAVQHDADDVQESLLA